VGSKQQSDSIHNSPFALSFAAKCKATRSLAKNKTKNAVLFESKYAFQSQFWLYKTSQPEGKIVDLADIVWRFTSGDNISPT